MEFIEFKDNSLNKLLVRLQKLCGTTLQLTVDFMSNILVATAIWLLEMRILDICM